MDDAVRKALIRKKELERELLRLEQFLNTYEELTGTKIARDELLASLRMEPKENIEGTKTPRKRVRLQTPKRIADTVEAILRETKEPLMRGRLIDELEARGVDIHSADKGKYLGTILWRHRDRFRNIEGRGYWLVSRPDPEDSQDFFTEESN